MDNYVIPQLNGVLIVKEKHYFETEFYKYQYSIIRSYEKFSESIKNSIECIN